jgi:hypothetical protein
MKNKQNNPKSYWPTRRFSAAENISNHHTSNSVLARNWKSILASVALFTGLSTLKADPKQVRVTVENLMPENGALITPPWIGFHGGEFDLFDSGSQASNALESIAEDGNPAGITTDFADMAGSGMDGVLNAIGPIAPGAKVAKDFFLDPKNPSQQFISYAAMLIPSNDAFIGNDNPTGYPIFNEVGEFIGLDLMIMPSMVYDAGVEVNDEVPENTPALGQMMPNTGQDENGLIRVHEGHLPSGAGGIVDREAFANADFTQLNDAIARIRVELIQPNPTDVTFRIKNQAPENGVYLTPVWMGFHDGTVQVFEHGQEASVALERIAEDGDASALNAWFSEQPGYGTQTVVTSNGQPPVFSPGTSREITMQLNANDPRHRYLSFVSMVIPSNDAFVANMEPIQVFDDEGNLVLDSYKLGGNAVLDAGTEQNSELPEATPLLGQAVPNTGETEGGVIQLHGGFKSQGMGGVLDNPMFSSADFTQPGYPLFSLLANPALKITSFEISDGNLNLQWTGGKAPYQVQRKTMANDAEWTKIGAPSAPTSGTWPMDSSQSFFRVISVEENSQPLTARYRLTFDATWSATTHPDSYPNTPHFSGLIGATHNDAGQFWQPGGMASPGIENMAETGSKSPLTNEIQTAITSGWADTLISGGGIGVSPGSVSVEFTANSTHSLLSLVSMIAPSPDWFVGVHGFNLRPEGVWIDELTHPLDPYDAGTDSGVNYTSANMDTSPQAPITRLVSAPVIHEGSVAPFGSFKLQRIE